MLCLWTKCGERTFGLPWVRVRLCGSASRARPSCAAACITGLTRVGRGRVEPRYHAPRSPGIRLRPSDTAMAALEGLLLSPDKIALP